MKKVNYFGYEVEVNDDVEYLAFRRVPTSNKYLGYALLGFDYKPYWNKNLKMWVGACTKTSINIPSYELEVLRNKQGIKPSQSLVAV